MNPWKALKKIKNIIIWIMILTALLNVMFALAVAGIAISAGLSVFTAMMLAFGVVFVLNLVFLLIFA